MNFQRWFRGVQSQIELLERDTDLYKIYYMVWNAAQENCGTQPTSTNKQIVGEAPQIKPNCHVCEGIFYCAQQCGSPICESFFKPV